MPSTLIGFLVPGSGDGTNGMVTDKGPLPPGGLTFMPSRPPAVIMSPRFGFAYDVGGAGRTAIRGSFSVLQDLLPASSDLGRNVPGFAPYSRVSTFLYGRIPDLAGTAAFDSPISPVAFDDYDPQTAYTYSLEVQQNVGRATTLSVAYVGNRYSNLRNNLNLNPIPPGARFDPANADPTNPASPLPDNFLRPMVGYGSINLRTNGGYSRYNSLQVTANRRVRSGLTFGSAYTLAVAKSTSGIPNFHDLAYTYDYAAGDRRHVLSLNGVYEIPASTWAPRVVRAVLDNWQVAVVAGFTTGAAGDRHVHDHGQLRLHGRRRRRAGQRHAGMRSDSSPRRAIARAVVQHVLLRSPVGPRRRRQLEPRALLRPRVEHLGSDPDEGRQARRLAGSAVPRRVLQLVQSPDVAERELGGAVRPGRQPDQRRVRHRHAGRIAADHPAGTAVRVLRRASACTDCTAGGFLSGGRVGAPGTA